MPAPPPDRLAWDDPWRVPIYYLGVTPRRVYAYCLDLAVVALLWLMAMVAAVIVGALTFGLLWPLLAVLLGLVPLAYHVVTVAGPRAATFGMRIAGLRVMSVRPGAEASAGHPAWWQALAHGAGFYLSVAVTGSLILLVPLFNPRRRAVHDWLAGVVVVNDPAGWR